MFDIDFYIPEKKKEWNDFVATSKNGTFLLNRDYMDYHADRFEDCSVLISRKGKLYSLFPANRREEVLWSHQGLTYGGMIMGPKVTVSELLDAWTLMNEFYRAHGIRKIIYKTIPFIYHRQPAQEDLYALFKVCKAGLIGRNISSAIFQENKLKFSESRKSGLRKSEKNHIYTVQSDRYADFWTLLNDNLYRKYGVNAVHTLEEMLLLQSRFPGHIKLYAAFQEEKMVGGTVIYITPRVVHTQYISASPEGKEIGALDQIFDFLINREYVDFPVFDFGQSTEEMGNVLNEALIFQKEGFGGRGITYDVYEYDL